MMRRTQVALAVLAVVGSGLYFYVLSRSVPPPVVIAALPRFELTERDGSTVGSGDLAGAPWVADFIFTRCAVYCPRLTARMKELRQSLPPRVKSVSFSVDPDYDTPEVLAEYARKWGIEGREWLFLTGERETIWNLIRDGFLQPVEETPEVEASPILHSNRFVLVDARGRMRGLYDAFDETAFERLLADLAAIEAEEEQ
jgi:protein SCO1/2